MPSFENIDSQLIDVNRCILNNQQTERKMIESDKLARVLAFLEEGGMDARFKLSVEAAQTLPEIHAKAMYVPADNCLYVPAITHGDLRAYSTVKDSICSVHLTFKGLEIGVLQFVTADILALDVRAVDGDKVGLYRYQGESDEAEFFEVFRDRTHATGADLVINYTDLPIAITIA